MQYKDIEMLNYKNLQDMEYVAALVGKVPYYDFETKKPKFIEKEKVQQVISELVKEGKFAEAKELVEASKIDYIKEIERNLVPRLLSVRISFPVWVKLYALALKYETSPSAVLRRLLINATENLVEDLNKSGVIHPRAYRLIRESLNNLKELQERKTFDEDEAGRKYMLIYEHEEPIGVSDLKHIHHFLKHLVKAYAWQENIPEGLVDLLFEKTVASNFETPEAFFYTYIGVFKDNNGTFLRIGPEVNTLDFRYVVFEYPIKAIQEFPAELVLKFHRMILFDAFVNCPPVIEKIRKKLETGEALTLEDYKSIFCGKFEKEIELLFREGVKPFIYPDERKEFVQPRFLPYCFEDYPLPLFKMNFLERELRIDGITLKKKASKNELTENLEKLENIFKDTYYEAVGLSEETVMKAKAKAERGEIDEDVLEVLSVAKGIEVFLKYLLYKQEGGKDLLSAFSKPSEVFTTTFPRPLVRIIELFSGKTIKETLEELILKEQL